MTASDDPTASGDPHRVQLRAGHEWTIADPSFMREPAGVDRLFLMVTAVFDRLTAGDEQVADADV